jgi:hypothetical protein
VILVLLGFFTVLVLAPVVQAIDPFWGWVTFASGVAAAALGAYEELFST